jgi:hypothetical protein
MGLAKTQQFIALILRLYKHLTVHSLMKLSYLTDYLFFEKTSRQPSSFSYRLMSFGPFDESIFNLLEGLIQHGLIQSHLNYTKTGLEHVTYVSSDAIPDIGFKTEFLPALSILEFHLIRDILYELMNYDEKRLTEMILKSKPIRALGITISGKPTAIGQILDFSLLTQY